MEELIQSAIQMQDRAYCPYSHFAVGAALQAENGNIYTGCNIESISFSPTCCAERTAFFKAVSEGTRRFWRIAIAGGKKGEKREKTTPCGVCLQVMLEFCDPETFEVILAVSEKEYEVRRLAELLPYGFRPTGLGAGDPAGNRY